MATTEHLNFVVEVKIEVGLQPLCSGTGLSGWIDGAEHGRGGERSAGVGRVSIEYLVLLWLRNGLAW